MKNKALERFELDNAGKIFPGQNTRTWANVFRIAVDLKEEIDPDILLIALKDTLRRIATFDVRLKNGFFWNYLEKNLEIVNVSPDIDHFGCSIKYKKDNGYLIRVYYKGCRISLDTFHAVSDGYGCTVFLCTMAARYLQLKGVDTGFGGMVLNTEDTPSKTEREDAFLRFASSAAKYSRADKGAYHWKGEPLPPHTFNYTGYTMSFSQVHKIAKGYGATVTELFAAMIIDILYRKQLREEKTQREVSAQVPVNLRKFYPTDTLRNFVLCLKVKIDPMKGEYTFEEILKSVSYQLRLANDEKEVNALMSKNVRLEKNPAMKYLPLAIKNAAVNLSFRLTREHTTSALVSNIGAVALPEGMKEHIEKFMFYTGVGKKNGTRCGVMGFGDKLTFTFSNCFKEKDVEIEFRKRLSEMGVEAEVETNN